MKKRIKGAIFDVDGTLLDSMPIWEDVGARYLQSLGIEAERNLSHKLEQLSVEEGAVYLKETYGLQQTEEEIIVGTLKIVENFYYYEAPLKSGVREFLEYLHQKEIPMVIATSSVREHVEAALQRLQVLSFFEKIFTCSEVGEGKTKPAIYQRAGEYLEQNFSDIYVFEDAIHALRTAKQAGFSTVAVYDTSAKKDWESLQKEADVSLYDMRELMNRNYNTL